MGLFAKTTNGLRQHLQTQILIKKSCYFETLYKDAVKVDIYKYIHRQKRIIYRDKWGFFHLLVKVTKKRSRNVCDLLTNKKNFSCPKLIPKTKLTRNS